jgi:hypothetical protein
MTCGGRPQHPPTGPVQPCWQGQGSTSPPKHHNQIRLILPSSHSGAEANSFPSMEYYETAQPKMGDTAGMIPGDDGVSAHCSTTVFVIFFVPLSPGCCHQLLSLASLSSFVFPCWLLFQGADEVVAANDGFDVIAAAALLLPPLQLKTITSRLTRGSNHCCCHHPPPPSPVTVICRITRHQFWVNLSRRLLHMSHHNPCVGGCDLAW